MRIHLCSLVLSAFLLTAAPAADRRVIAPPEFAPAPGAAAPPYSPGILIDGTLYVAGQVGEDLKTKEVPAEFESEVKTCLDRVGLVLKAAGMSFQDAVSVQVYLTDIDLFPRMNAVYTTYFKDPRPARTTVAVVKLPSAKAHIEIAVTAKK
jgi:2-iminobutanoate/2-iminopropanoate deaminase